VRNLVKIQDLPSLWVSCWHSDILDERRTKIELGEAELVSLDEAKRILRE